MMVVLCSIKGVSGLNMQVLDGCPIQREGCESLQYEGLSGGCHLQYSGWLSYSINNNVIYD